VKKRKNTISREKKGEIDEKKIAVTAEGRMDVKMEIILFQPRVSKKKKKTNGKPSKTDCS
jgi:hypothetical protein